MPESRPVQEITIRDLIHSALRLRPDRLVIGEIRGAEALDLLQAMNTGHDGSLTTCHANTPRDAVGRLENMVMMAGYDLPVSAIREQIASALNLIVQQTRLPDGSRKIVGMAEVLPLRNGEYNVHDIMRWRTRAIGDDGKLTGDFEICDYVPSFKEEPDVASLPLK